jgi:predicted MFS family arabinose efflux permease
MGGIQGSAYFELLTRMVPVNRTASMWAIRNVLWAFFGISAGFAIKLILDKYPGTFGYGILHLCTFSMMMVSIIVFSFVKEDNIPDHRNLPKLTFREGFASIKRLCQDNPSVVRFVITRMFTTAIFVVVPFLAIRAIDRTGEPLSLVGLLVLIQMVGFISGNVLAGYLGDRMGTRIPMLLARIALLVISLYGPFAIEIWHFMAIFFLLGFGLSTAQVGDITMVFDFAPSIRRKFYYAVMATLLVPGMLSSSLLSAVLLNMESGFSIACLIAVAGLALSLHQLFLLKDPRNARSVS